MATFLVTGGGGFIGSNLCHALLARGDRVRAFDNFATGRRENLAGLEAQTASGQFLLIEGDVTDAAAVARAVEGVDYVLHEAAIPSVPRSVEDPSGTDHVNVHGTVTLLHAAVAAKVKRVVFAASSSAYGEKTPGEAKVETMMPDPLSPYAAQKLACEHYLRVFHVCYGLPTVALRYFNVFGPRQDPKSQYAAVIPNFVTAALAGRAATIYGDGGQTRDFCYIDNVVEANIRACEAEGVSGQVFNIACGEAASLLEVVDAIATETGTKVAPRHEPGRTGDIRHSLADIDKARSMLGYTGKVRFTEGIARTVAWYRQKR
ncbi:MAG: SDR family oxidoreductase [Polyangia bacterium]